MVEARTEGDADELKVTRKHYGPPAPLSSPFAIPSRGRADGAIALISMPWPSAAPIIRPPPADCVRSPPASIYPRPGRPAISPLPASAAEAAAARRATEDINRGRDPGVHDRCPIATARPVSPASLAATFTADLVEPNQSRNHNDRQERQTRQESPGSISHFHDLTAAERGAGKRSAAMQ